MQAANTLIWIVVVSALSLGCGEPPDGDSNTPTSEASSDQATGKADRYGASQHSGYLWGDDEFVHDASTSPDAAADIDHFLSLDAGEASSSI